MTNTARSDIAWIADCLVAAPNGKPTSLVASTRLRSILPALAVAASGLPVRLISFDSWLIDDTAYRLLVVGKLVPVSDPTRFHRYAAETLKRLRHARHQGAVVVADFSDDHFSHPHLGYYWRELAGLTDMAVGASDRMAEVLRAHSSGVVHVIPDPLSSPRGEVKVLAGRTWFGKMFPGPGRDARSPPIKLVWYGHPNNLRHLWPWLDTLCSLANDRPWVLWIVTQARADVVGALEKRQQQVPAHGLVELIDWTEEAQWSVVASSDVVLLPSDEADRGSSVKSANRLTDALHAGRHVIASPLPSYRDFADYVDLSGNLIAALDDLRLHPQKWRDRTSKGQAHVEATVSQKRVAQLWADLIRANLDTSRPPSEQPTEPIFDIGKPAHDATEPRAVPVMDGARPIASVRLNLGCGDKILPNYINVDVVSSRAGFEPDVICDLHELAPFPDNHADEVMAIHVVEHFWRWEVEAILREWVRVLKPGGRMVLECPNLLSACREIIDHPESADAADRTAQRTLWVLYGDPAWQDPLMTHRWAYTPTSLAALMRSAGLVDVRQEPAQYKLREPRDMRMVGVKP